MTNNNVLTTKKAAYIAKFAAICLVRLVMQ